jgi:DNA repair exonuclease SbcCD ATPase subunit
MENIKEKLKDLVVNIMIPEVEEYLEDLYQLLETDSQTLDDKEAMEEMESFLVELQNVLAVIEEDKTADEEYQRIYDYIMQNIQEHENEHENIVHNN